MEGQAAGWVVHEGMPWRDRLQGRTSTRGCCGGIGCRAVMGAHVGVVLDSAPSLSPFVTQLHRQIFFERTHACESVIAGLALGTGVT